MTIAVDAPVELDERRTAGLQERLAASLLAVRRRTTAGLDVERRLGLAGGGLLVGGVVLVLLGWYGAAHTSRVYLQIPYLISGGLLGVVAAFAGGSLYFASWVTRLVHDERARAARAEAASAEVAATLLRIESLLAGGAGPAAGADLVATPSGRLAHRPGCPTVAGRPDPRRVAPGRHELAGCRMCQPDPAVVGAAASTASS